MYNQNIMPRQSIFVVFECNNFVDFVDLIIDFMIGYHTRKELMKTVGKNMFCCLQLLVCLFFLNILYRSMKCHRILVSGSLFSN